MNVSKILVVVISLLVCASLSTSQITVSYNDIPGPGESIAIRGTEDLVDVNIGAPGANQTWTIPDYPELSPEMQADFMAPTSTPFSLLFPTATRCMVAPAITEFGAGIWPH